MLSIVFLSNNTLELQLDSDISLQSKRIAIRRMVTFTRSGLKIISTDVEVTYIPSPSLMEYPENWVLGVWPLVIDYGHKARNYRFQIFKNDEEYDSVPRMDTDRITSSQLLPWGVPKERARFPSNVNIETDIRPGEFVMRTLFAEFTIQVRFSSFLMIFSKWSTHRRAFNPVNCRSQHYWI